MFIIDANYSDVTLILIIDIGEIIKTHIRQSGGSVKQLARQFNISDTA